jgi:hypothetical protein
VSVTRRSPSRGAAPEGSLRLSASRVMSSLLPKVVAPEGLVVSVADDRTVRRRDHT